MKRVWEFVATDMMGVEKTYQHAGPDVPEAAVLEHLKRHFRNCTITSLKEIGPKDLKPPTGVVQSHLFDFGIIRAIRQAVGLDRIIKPSLRDVALAGRSGKRPSILDRLKR
jgi:hypothetical protein